MKKILAALLFNLVLVSWVSTANATLITDLYGDKDGFGVGTPIADGGAYGGGFVDHRDAGDVADAPNTDIFRLGYEQFSD